MFDGLLIGLLLHQFACWIGNSRKQEQLWVKVLVVSYARLWQPESDPVVLSRPGILWAFMLVSTLTLCEGLVLIYVARLHS